MNLKTRCQQCVSVAKKAIEYPCRVCAEIQHPGQKCANHFTDKNLIKEGSK